MIDIFSDDVIPLKDVGNLIPGGVSPTTIGKWWRRGVLGIQLETALIGHRRYTSKAALKEFFSKCAQVDVEKRNNPAPRTSETEERLRLAGLI